MDEDVTDQTAGAPHSPAAAAGGGTVIEAFPGELGAGRHRASRSARRDRLRRRKFPLPLKVMCADPARSISSHSYISVIRHRPVKTRAKLGARLVMSPRSARQWTRSHEAAAKVNAQSPTRSTSSAASTLKSTCGHRCRLSRNWWFESTPLQRRVRCELNLGKGGLPMRWPPGLPGAQAPSATATTIPSL